MYISIYIYIYIHTLASWLAVSRAGGPDGRIRAASPAPPRYYSICIIIIIIIISIVCYSIVCYTMVCYVIV